MPLKLLFDQNISYRILKLLPETFEGSTHVKTAGLLNQKDKLIWEFAKENQYTIVTQDSDFNDLSLLYGPPPKIIWIRTGNLSTDAISVLFSKYVEDFEHFILNENFGCFEILKFNS